MPDGRISDYPFAEAELALSSRRFVAPAVAFAPV
jgi:hypothetical protein